MTDPLKKSRFSYSIYQGDTLKSITKIPANSRFEKDHILRCGKYIVQIYKNDSLYHEFKEIQVECGYNMTYTINLAAKTSYETLEKGEPDMFSTVPSYNGFYEYVYQTINLGYSTRILESSDYPIQHAFLLGIGGFINRPITRHFGFGFNPESNVRIMLPKKGADLRVGQTYSHERYFYWELKTGIYFRFSTFNMKEAHDGGLFFDLGANYHLPIFFRHVGILDNHKDITRYIHRFNDFSLTARIGNDRFSLFGQYRLFDFVKSPFPQAPILSFGFSVFVDE